MVRLLFLIFLFFCLFTVYGQENTPMHVSFYAPSKHELAFDKLKHKEWKAKYKSFEIEDLNYYVPSMRVDKGAVAKIKCVVKNKKNYTSKFITFQINNQALSIEPAKLNQDTIEFNSPVYEDDFSLKVYYKQELIGQLDVKVQPILTNKLIIIPLIRAQLPVDSIQAYLDSVYSQAGIKFDVEMNPLFLSDEIDTLLLSNPSIDNDRYTSEMINIRNIFFGRHPHADNNSNYLFIVPGFINPEVEGYMVRNRGIGFIKNGTFQSIKRNVARQLGFGLGSLNSTWRNDGPQRGSTNNLMDDGNGTHLTSSQWESIRIGCLSTSYYDDYEDVQTNSGLIAYYFWEEDSLGHIILKKSNLLGSITRPYKKNQYSVYLDIDSLLYKTVFKPFGVLVSVLHIIVLVLLFILSIFFRKKLVKKWRDKIMKLRLMRFALRIFNFLLFVIVYTLLFLLINMGYSMFEVNGGAIKDLNNMNLVQAKNTISNNNVASKLEEKHLGSELVVKKNSTWYLMKRKNVLYFTLKKTGENWEACTFIKDSDTLSVSSKQYRKIAESHYMVFNYLDSLGNQINQRVFNHIGLDITEKLTIDDPSRRILLFVNGYRPTSMSQSIEENFADIQKNGFEFSNSNNKIYNFDRYDYWRPWNEFDLQFKKRINPDETLYADGHFTVSTSNHRSLVKFTSLASQYPKRCKDSSNHTCQETMMRTWSSFGFKSNQPTVNLFNLRPNRSGFEQRKEGGKIAGRNLIQMFNELPNKSQNDTLYIVAHSMGYAYSLGIIEQMRGQINFGGFYIIAPENASAGSVNPNEWQELWQYGNDFESEKYKSPCLLDGVAPQTKVGGISNSRRAFIPESNYIKKGFYDSHFIGYYNWVLDIKKGETGHVKQH